MWIYMNYSTCRYLVRPVSFVENAFFFPLFCLGFFVKSQATVVVSIYFWDFNPILLIILFVSIQIPCGIFHCWHMYSRCAAWWSPNTWSNQCSWFCFLPVFPFPLTRPPCLSQQKSHLVLQWPDAPLWADNQTAILLSEGKRRRGKNGEELR